MRTSIVMLLVLSATTASAFDDTFGDPMARTRPVRRVAVRRQKMIRPLMALTQTSTPIMVQHVERAMTAFLGGATAPRTYAQLAMLRQVLAHPNFRANAAPDAKRILERAIISYEDARPRYRIERFEKDQLQRRAFDRTMYGY